MEKQYLYIIVGIAYAGKSSLAKAISEAKGAKLISRDGLFWQEETRILGKTKQEKLTDEEDKKAWEDSKVVYRDLTKEELVKGNSVVLDDINLTREDRDYLRALAEEAGAIPLVIFLNTPVEVTRERQRKSRITGDHHDVSEKNILDAIRELEPPAEDENVVEYTPETELENWLAKLPG